MYFDPEFQIIFSELSQLGKKKQKNTNARTNCYQALIICQQAVLKCPRAAKDCHEAATKLLTNLCQAADNSNSIIINF